MTNERARREASSVLERRPRQITPIESATIAGWCFGLACLLLLVFAWVQCGTTTMQKISAANQAAGGLTKVVRPLMDASCMAKAKACKTKADTVCKSWIKCRDLRRGYYDAINGVHIAAASAAVIVATGKDEQLAEVLKRCIAALETARKLAGAAGFL